MPRPRPQAHPWDPSPAQLTSQPRLSSRQTQTDTCSQLAWGPRHPAGNHMSLGRLPPLEDSSCQAAQDLADSITRSRD